MTPTSSDDGSDIEATPDKEAAPEPPSATAAPSATSRSETSHSMRIPLPSLRTAVLAFIFIVLAAGVVVSQVQLSDQRATNGARTSASAAAQVYAVDVASYNYQHLARDFGNVEEHATPTFRKTFKASSTALSKVLTQYHAIATAHVVAVGVDSVTSSRAVVLLFVDQTVNNTAQKSGPTKDNSRIKMTLLRSGGQWHIDQVELL